MLILAVPLAVSAAGFDWEVISNRDGVEVATRKVAELKFKEIRATGEVDFAAERLFNALGDLERFPEIMPPTESLKILHREGSTVWVHVVINPPWVSRRDYCVRATYEREPDGTLVNTWRQTNDYCPASPKGVVRMLQTQGSWRLTPVGAHKTRVVYTGLTDPAGSLPAWIVNRAAARSMGEMFGSLRKAAALDRYQHCPANSPVCGPLALLR